MAPAAADDDGTYCLADLLTAWGADDALVRGVAPCWRARVVKHAESEEEALERHKEMNAKAETAESAAEKAEVLASAARHAANAQREALKDSERDVGIKVNTAARASEATHVAIEEHRTARRGSLLGVPS